MFLAFLQIATEQFNLFLQGRLMHLGSIDELPKIIVSKNLIAEDGFFVLEHTPRNSYESFDGLAL
jgi:hypothetical protein